MKRLFLFLLALSFFMACASHQEYNTASFKYKSYRPSMQNIALNPNGLTPQQIKVIASTKAPHDFPLDISVIFLTDGYINSDLKDVLQFGIISQLKTNPKISRITIIPDFIIPNSISFSSIQELGIRSLSQLVIVFNMNSSDIFKEYVFMEGRKIKVTSRIDYMIVDSYTSAILTTERLYSEKIYNDEAFKAGEREKAVREIFREQAIILGHSINTLFENADNQGNN